MALRTGARFAQLGSRMGALRPTATRIRVLSTAAGQPAPGDAPLAQFPGARAPYASELQFVTAESFGPLPVFRVLDDAGRVTAGAQEPELDRATLLHMYKTMVQLAQMDKVLYESQRQGRISFYMTNTGEEGMHVGSAAALDARDLVFAQYREVGVLLLRGAAVAELVDQCCGNARDPGRGRQMPVHYGSKPLNFVTISSPLATQMPQAVGAAYALKRLPGNERCVACYFGEGAASEGDAHAAFNFAATLDCPVLMICRNNGYAISTGTSEQYRGDGVAARGPALGVPTVRVDGTDPLAVYVAVRRARQLALGESRPVLVEAMCYREGHHSTSDDSSAYRPAEEARRWAEAGPLRKFYAYLVDRGHWDERSDAAWRREARELVVRTMMEAERRKKPHWREMLEDVYYDTPPRIRRQMQQVEKHLHKYGEQYPLAQHEAE